MRINKNCGPVERKAEDVRLHAPCTSRSQKTLAAFVDWVWERRKALPRDLYTIPEPVEMYYMWIHEDPARPSKLWRVRMGRELRRVGARQVPERRCKTFGEEHRTMPQLWYLRNARAPAHLSSVGAAWEEYERQRLPQQLCRQAEELSARIARQGSLGTR